MGAYWWVPSVDEDTNQVHRDILKNTAWSMAQGKNDSFIDVYCNANSVGMIYDSKIKPAKFEMTDEYATMVALVAVGFVFLTLVLCLMPCLMCGRCSGNKGCGCVGGTAFISWVFYLTAWAYWAAKDNPCKKLSENSDNYDHHYQAGFACTVTLWILLTFAIPCMCGGASQKNKGN